MTQRILINNIKADSPKISSASAYKALIEIIVLLRNIGKSSEALKILSITSSCLKKMDQKIFKEFLFVEGDLLLDTMNFKDAAHIYSRIISKTKISNLEKAIALSNRAFAYWNLKQYKKALTGFRAAIIANPKNHLAQRHLGEILIERRCYKQALFPLRKALRINNNDSVCLRLLGIAYYGIGEWSNAYRMLRAALHLDPQDKIAEVGIKKIEQWFDLK